ncbi:hypothetical protein FRC07_008086 [Ceratobasidium sp. 392]|nr:hypothetical protein FRC07_008086 [Ceratobasidium sp. 392]
MSNRGEQIVVRLFLKVVLLIWDARSTSREPPPATAKSDKWFQLEVRDDGAFAGLTQEVRELAADGNGPLELHVRTVLVLPHLAPPSAQALVLLVEPISTTPNTTPGARRVRVDMPASARGILLEDWTLELDRSTSYTPPVEDPNPGIYKQAIALIRSLFALLRYVPTWRLHRGLGSGAPMQITVGPTLVADPLDDDILGFEHRLVPDEPGPSTFSFPPIATPLGSITLRVRHRPNARFRLDPLENLWSSAFASGPPSPGTQAALTLAQRQGAGPSSSTSPASPSPPTPARAPGIDLDTPAFTPTLLAARQRASLTGSGSPLRPASRTGGPSTTPTIGPGFPLIRPRTVSQLSSGGEPGSPRRGVIGMGDPGSPRRMLSELSPRSPPGSPRLGVETFRAGEGGSGLSRTRRESLLSPGPGRSSGTNTPLGATGGTGTGLVLGTTIREGAGSDMPPPSPRRPSSIFKGPTIASSPRTTGIGSGTSPLGMGGSPRTTPGLGIGTPPRSALGVGSDGRRSLDSGEREGGQTQPQPIKRYEGSFGHRAARSQGSLGSGGVVGSAGTGTGIPGSSGAGGAGAGGSAAGGGPGSVGATSTGSGGQGAHTRLATIGSQSYASQTADVEEMEEISQYLADIAQRPQLGLDVSGTGTERRASGSLLRRPPLSALGTETGMGSERFPLSSPIQERLPLGSPIQDRLPLESPSPRRVPLGEPEPSRAERFPPSSLPTRISALPPVSPDVPRPLPPPLQSIPPSPAESAWPSRLRDRSTSRERGLRGLSRERGGSRGLFGDAVLAPLPEHLGDRVRAMSLAERPSSALRERHERERTTSITRRMLTTQDEVDAAMQMMTASFQASYAPPSPGTPNTQLGESSGVGRRQIGNDEIVGRLELGGSGSVGGRSAGGLRPGRDTDTWKETGEWDQRMGGWR